MNAPRDRVASGVGSTTLTCSASRVQSRTLFGGVQTVNVWMMVGLGAIVLALLVTGLIVREGRRLMGSRAGVFRNFARRREWKYRVEDDGRAQDALEGLVALGPGTPEASAMTRPQNVIQGTVEEGEVLICTFARRLDGENIPFQVVLIETDCTFPEPVIMRFGRAQSDGADRADILYGDRNFTDVDGVATTLWSEESDLLTGPLRRRLTSVFRDLPWPVDLQVRDSRVAVYTCDPRDPAAATRMERLLSAAREVTALLLSEVPRNAASG